MHLDSRAFERHSAKSFGEQGRHRKNLQDALDLQRRNKFLEALKLEEIATNGLSTALMEWLLVSQQVLLPQNSDNSPQLPIVQNPSRPINDLDRNYVWSVYNGLDPAIRGKIPRSLFQKLFNQNYAVDAQASELLSALEAIETPLTRYQFSKSYQNGKTDLLDFIFAKSFAKNIENLTNLAEQAEGALFYPIWKKKYWIQTPEVLGKIIGNSLFQIVATFAFSFYAHRKIKEAYALSSHLVAAKVVPFVINKTPIEVVRAVNKSIDFAASVSNNRLGIVLSLYAIKSFTEKTEIPYVSNVLRSIDLWSLFANLAPDTEKFSAASIYRTLGVSQFFYSQLSSLSGILHNFATDSEFERRTLSEQKSRALWHRIAVSQ